MSRRFQPCLHVGLPKTGTTTLQQGFFDRHQDVCNLGKPFHDSRIQELVANINIDDGIDYDPNRARALFDEVVLPHLHGDRLPVLSNEGFTSPASADRRLVAERLHTLFAPAKVIITIRGQVPYLESWYLQESRHRNVMSMGQWLDREWPRRQGGIFPCLMYFELAEAYAELFGRENVAVFAFEQFRKDPATFVASVCAWLGIDEPASAALMRNAHDNPRISATSLAYRRLRSWLLPDLSLAHFMPSSANAIFQQLISRGGAAQVPIPTTWVERIDDRYRESNRKLAAAYDIPLAEHGYPL